MQVPKTMTVGEFMNTLLQLAKKDKKILKYKVYLSIDPEGNGYSTVDPNYSFQFGDDDKILTIFPFAEGLQDEDIAPKEHARIMEELRAENEYDAKVEARAS
jgi:hypothetical protein